MYVYIEVCTFHQFILVIVICTVWINGVSYFWYWRYWCHVYCCSIIYILKFSQWQNSLKSSWADSCIRVQTNKRHKKKITQFIWCSCLPKKTSLSVTWYLGYHVSVYSKSTQTTPNHKINNHFPTYKDIKLQGKESRNDTTYTVFIQTQHKVLPLNSIFKYVQPP